MSSKDMHWAFYAVPGCGKTRSIENLLSRNWGFFFTAGSLPITGDNTKRSLASASNIYDPRREGYSKDLHYLWKTMNACSRMFPADGDVLLEYQDFPYLKDCLVYSRILVFEKFLSIASEALPSDWLEFQRCFDPFSSLFWFLILQLPTLADDNTDLFDCGPYDMFKMLSGIKNYLRKKKNWNGNEIGRAHV